MRTACLFNSVCSLGYLLTPVKWWPVSGRSSNSLAAFLGYTLLSTVESPWQKRIFPLSEPLQFRVVGDRIRRCAAQQGASWTRLEGRYAKLQRLTQRGKIGYKKLGLRFSLRSSW